MKNTSIDNSATLYELNKNDFVVDWYGPDADGNWYRVYKSGWVEQGGIFEISTDTDQTTINFLKEFNNTNYHINSTAIDSSYNVRLQTGTAYNSIKSTTNITGVFVARQATNDALNYPSAGTLSWKAEGQGA